MTAPKVNIKFSYNWNNKLNNIVFCTIRKTNSFYCSGHTYDLYLKSTEKNSTSGTIIKFIGKGEILEKLSLPIEKIPEYIFWLDTGFSKGETISVIQKIWNVPDDQIESFIVDILFIKKHKQK
jgi:hypothetical protein